MLIDDYNLSYQSTSFIQYLIYFAYYDAILLIPKSLGD